MKKTLAIFSPNQNAYSETFIQAHKNLPFDIKFYFNGYLPSALENKSMLDLSYAERFQKKILKGFSAAEKKLLFSLKKEKVDVVLAEYGPTAVESLKVVKYLNLPLIAHFHGADASVRNLIEHYKVGYQNVFDYARSIIAVSEKMKRDLIKMGCAEEKIKVNPCAPNDVFFGLKPNYANQQFISIGRFVEKKSPHLTILAFQRVLKEFPTAQLIMVGEGELLPICNDIVKIFMLEKNIHFKGAQPTKSIQKLMEQSIAFVQHSVTATNGDSEGTPVAILEAQAAGLAVIATNHAGIPDVVVNNQTGLLVEERNVEDMADNMKRILSENGLAKQYGAAGRKITGERFTMEKHLKVLAKEINRAIGK